MALEKKQRLLDVVVSDLLFCRIYFIFFIFVVVVGWFFRSQLSEDIDFEIKILSFSLIRIWVLRVDS